MSSSICGKFKTYIQDQICSPVSTKCSTLKQSLTQEARKTNNFFKTFFTENKKNIQLFTGAFAFVIGTIALTQGFDISLSLLKGMGIGMASLGLVSIILIKGKCLIKNDRDTLIYKVVDWRKGFEEKDHLIVQQIVIAAAISALFFSIYHHPFITGILAGSVIGQHLITYIAFPKKGEEDAPDLSEASTA